MRSDLFLKPTAVRLRGPGSLFSQEPKLSTCLAVPAGTRLAEWWVCTRDPSQIWLVKSQEKILQVLLPPPSGRATPKFKAGPGRMERHSDISSHSSQLQKTLKTMGNLPQSPEPMMASPTLLVTRPRQSRTGSHSELAANHPTGRQPQTTPPHLWMPRPRSRATARTQVGPSRFALRWTRQPIRSAISSNLAI